MPECLLVGNPEEMRSWQWAVENLGDDWRCLCAAQTETAYAMLMGQRFDLCLALADRGRELGTRLAARPPLSPPWLLVQTETPWADGRLDTVEAVFRQWTAWETAGWLPRLSLIRHGQFTCLARGLMKTLAVPEGLRAWQFLPDLAALCAVHPPLMADLHRRLYPLLARRHGLTPAAVERRLRLAIESTWSSASLTSLERFFGHSVDPERGKPTNREFLCRVQERLLLAAARLR